MLGRASCTGCLTPRNSFAVVHRAGKPKQRIDCTVGYWFEYKAPSVLVPGVGRSGEEEVKAKFSTKHENIFMLGTVEFLALFLTISESVFPIF